MGYTVYIIILLGWAGAGIELEMYLGRFQLAISISNSTILSGCRRLGQKTESVPFLLQPDYFSPLLLSHSHSHSHSHIAGQFWFDFYSFFFFFQTIYVLLLILFCWLIYIQSSFFIYLFIFNTSFFFLEISWKISGLLLCLHSTHRQHIPHAQLLPAATPQLYPLVGIARYLCWAQGTGRFLRALLRAQAKGASFRAWKAAQVHRSWASACTA